MFLSQRRILVAALGITLSIAGLAQAQTTWTGAFNQDWENAANWTSSPAAPTGNYIVNTATGNFPIFNPLTFNFPADLILADGGANSARFDHRDGSLFLQDSIGNWFIVGRGANTATATYNLANTAAAGAGISGFGMGSGDVNVGKLFVGGTSVNNGGTGTVNINTTGSVTANSNVAVSGSAASIAVGYGAGAAGTINLENGTINSVGEVWVGTLGTGTVNQTGGTVNVSAALLLARNINNTQTGDGTYTISGTGVLNTENDLVLAFAGNNTAVGTMNVNAGGTVNVATTTERWLIVNRFDSASGNLNVNGGTVNLNANTDLRFSTGGNATLATSVVTLSSGAITSYSGNQTGSSTSGVIDLNQSANNTTVNNTFHLNGGVLTMSGVVTSQNNGTAAFNFNGGLLKASNNNTGFFVLGGANQRANVRDGGAKIDTNGDPLGVPAGFNVTIAESLLHSNIGGDNPIDGGLTKSGAGTLTLSTATHTYTGPTTVSGGTLQVNAGLNATGAISVAAGATFQGQGTVVGATTLNGSTLGNTSTTTPLTLSALTFAANGNTFNLNPGAGPAIVVTGALTTGGNTATINAAKPFWINGTYQLVGFGSLAGSLGNFTLAPLSGLNARQLVTPLSNTGTALQITVSGDHPIWTAADNGNWVVGATGPNKNWKLAAAGTPTDYIELDAVVFDDTAPITTVDITSGTGVSPSTVTFNNSTKAYTINATGGSGILGSALIMKNGTNSLTINSANTHSGGTMLNAGTLNLGSATALGTGRLTIDVGSPNSAKTLGNSSGGAMVVTTNNLQTWNDDFTFAGTVDGLSDLDLGIGEITMGGAGTSRTVTVTEGTFAVGELKAATHGLIKQGNGTLALTSTGGSVAGSNIAGTLHIAAGTVQINRTGAVGGDPNTGDAIVGGLTGPGRVTNGAGQVRWLFVNQAAATTSTFNGTLENGGSFGLGLVKRGDGTLTLAGVNTMTDLVTVEAGTLNFTGGGSLANALGYTLAAGNGVFQVNSASQISSGLITVASNGNGAFVPGSGSSARVEFSGSSSYFNALTLAPRNDSGGSEHIRNVNGANTISGAVLIVGGGNFTRLRSDAGTLTLSGGVTTNSGANRNLILLGAGNGELSGVISNNSANAAGTISILKQGTGTWTLSAFNTTTGLMAALEGTLRVTQADGIADLADVSIRTGGFLELANGGTTDVIDVLYIDGLSVPVGIYGPAGTPTSLITGGGSLQVSRYRLPGDFDFNNTVNAADLVVWRAGFTAGNATGDTDGDSDTDGNDFLLWQRFLGQTHVPAVVASAPVPEPTSLVGAVFASIALANFRRSRRMAG